MTNSPLLSLSAGGRVRPEFGGRVGGEGEGWSRKGSDRGGGGVQCGVAEPGGFIGRRRAPWGGSSGPRDGAFDVGGGGSLESPGQT